MQFEGHSRRWALVASAAIHALLWGALMQAMQRRAPPQVPGAPPAPPLQVRLVALPVPRPMTAAAPAPAPMPTESAPGAGMTPHAKAAAREDIRYYDPDELERELILLRDRSADDGVAVLRGVVMQLFVDKGGRVVLIRFDGEALPQAEQQRLRAAFMTLEFLPALRHGQPVPARIKIELLPDADG